MKRREFVQSTVTLALLPSFPDRAYETNRVSDEAFEIELRRRFERLPSFLKKDGVRFDLATAVLVLSKPEPIIELLPRATEAICAA